MMKININKFIIYFSFYTIAFSQLFLRWYNNSNYGYIFALVFSIVYIVINVKKLRFSPKVIYPILFLLVYILINYITTSNHQYFFEEFISVFKLIPFAIYFYFITQRKEFFSGSILKSALFIFNIYYIVNFIIIILQINIPGFMVHNFSNNSLYLDNICGLLGNNGTHMLGIFSLVTLYLNLYYYFDSNSKVKLFSRTMFWFILMTSLYTSAFNDNRFYYFLIIIFLLPVFVKNKNMLFKKNINYNNLLKSLLLILISILSIFSIYKFNSYFKDLIDDKIINDVMIRTIEKMNGRYQYGRTSGEERIELFKYALKNGNGFFFGKGIGAIKVVNDITMPIHFGMNEVSSKVYTGGIIYVFLILCSYLAFPLCYKKTSIYIKLYLIALGIIFSFYTQIFTQPSNCYLWCLMNFIYMEVIGNDKNLNAEMRTYLE